MNLESSLNLLKEDNIAEGSDDPMENSNVKQLQRELKNRKLPLNGSKCVSLNRKHAGLRTQQSETKKDTEFENPLRTINQHNSTLGSNLEVFTDGNLRAKEWELIERAKKLIEKERQILTQERELAIEVKNFELGITSTNSKPKLVCSIKEIADAIPNFSPNDVFSLSTESWVKRVEGLLKLFEWDEKALLMAIVSKMQGPARYWWDTKHEICTSWNQLADELKTNFRYKFSEFEIHQQLLKKVKKPNETVESYCFEMKMLGERIQLADKTIIQYILMGLNDPRLSLSLAACNFKDIAELIEKIRWFQSIRANARTTAATRPSTSVHRRWQQRNQVETQNTVNCDQAGPFSRQCTQARKRSWTENRDNTISTEAKKGNNYRINIVGCKTNTDCYSEDEEVDPAEC